MPMEYVPIYPTKNQQAKLPKNGALRGTRDVGITRDLSESLGVHDDVLDDAGRTVCSACCL